jgi:putative transposase
MARHPRYGLVDQPQHVIQRGNNRIDTFLDAEDFLSFRNCLLLALERYQCHLHAYVFMHNHVHLLMSPREAGGVSKVMQSIGRRYVARFNKRYGRTGGLWEGRYRATAVDTDDYLFTCYRYIELNPVRAGLVDHPSQYRWSSFATNAHGVEDPLVSPHPRYAALASSPASRQRAYGALFKNAIDDATLQSIRDATNKSWALGDGQFRRRLSNVDRRAYPLRRWSDTAAP